MESVISRANEFINEVSELELENASALKTIQTMQNNIAKMDKESEIAKEAYDITVHAIEILTKLSDESVEKAYKFLETNINEALERMFKHSTRKIKIKEYSIGDRYQQLELELHVGNGEVVSLKTDSGHGVGQIISLLSIVSLIVITGGRRLVVMDEILSGLSAENRRIISEIMWAFTDIGFQFLVNEHGFIPKGAYVYHLDMTGDIGKVVEEFYDNSGTYLQTRGDTDVKYNLEEETDEDGEKADVDNGDTGYKIGGYGKEQMGNSESLNENIKEVSKDGDVISI